MCLCHQAVFFLVPVTGQRCPATGTEECVKSHPTGAMCCPCGANNLKIGLCVTYILALCAAHNAARNDTNGPLYKRDITTYNTTLQCTEQEGRGALVQNDYPPQGLAAQSLPIPVKPTHVTQCKFDFIFSTTCNNYRCTCACGTVFTARCTDASTVLGVVILSVRPSVTSVLCD